MAFPAARMNDAQRCDAHGPAPLPEGAPSVRINGQPTVRVGDAFPCGGCQNRVQTGASTVTFGAEFAARAADASDHGGRIVIGSNNVVIGGPTGMGCVGAGKSACQAMAAGRASGKIQQSYGNCVLESVRQLIHRATPARPSEDDVLNHALSKRPPLCGNTPNAAASHGGSNGQQGAQILNDFGVPAERMPPFGTRAATLDDVKQAISERRGIVAFVNPIDVWPPGKTNDPVGSHAVVVTGVELDPQGNVVAVFVNDTGLGECGRKIPADKFAAGMRNEGGSTLLVTKGAIW